MGLILPNDVNNNLVITLREDEDGDAALYYGNIKVAFFSDSKLNRITLSADEVSILNQHGVDTQRRSRDNGSMLITVGLIAVG